MVLTNFLRLIVNKLHGLSGSDYSNRIEEKEGKIKALYAFCLIGGSAHARLWDLRAKQFKINILPNSLNLSNVRCK